MAGDFSARIGALSRQVGHGRLTGRVTVDQAYAQDQHETTWYRHAPGRTHHYLSRPLDERARGWLVRLAKAAGNGRITAEMVEVVEEWARASAAVTPIDYDDLPRSHHPQVFDAGAVVYDRPPAQRRLTDAELAAKTRGRRGRR